MAETITVPGMGKIEQKYVWGFGAATVAIVGYAWYRRGSGGGADVEIIPNPDSIPETDRTPVVGDSSGSWDTTNPEQITTNAQWTKAATDHLVTLGGWEAGAVGVALGKYLDRKPLTAAEVEIVQAARAATGDPPQNGPYAIITGLPNPAPSSQKPGSPTGVKIAKRTPGKNVLAWSYNGTGGNITRFVVEAQVLNKYGNTTTTIVPAVWRPNTYSWIHEGGPKGTRIKYTVIAFNGDVRGGQASTEGTFL